MPKLDGMKPAEAEENLMNRVTEINNYLQSLEGEYTLGNEINFGETLERNIKKGTYTVSAIKFTGGKPVEFSGEYYGTVPNIHVNGAGEGFDVKATKFLRLIGDEERSEELHKLFREFKKERNTMMKDAEDMGKKQVEKVVNKTGNKFLRLIGLKGEKK